MKPDGKQCTENLSGHKPITYKIVVSSLSQQMMTLFSVNSSIFFIQQRQIVHRFKDVTTTTALLILCFCLSCNSDYSSFSPIYHPTLGSGCAVSGSQEVTGGFPYMRKIPAYESISKIFTFCTFMGEKGTY